MILYVGLIIEVSECEYCPETCAEIIAIDWETHMILIVDMNGEEWEIHSDDII